MVTIFLLSWNHERYISQAVLSICAQTYTDLEVVYVDNNSNDRSFEIGRDALSNSGIPFSAWKREKQYNIAANHNYMLPKCKGEFLCLLSADDWLHQDNIFEKMKEFEKDSFIGLVYSGGYKYYEDIGIYEPFKAIIFPPADILQELLQRNFISAVGGIIRLEVLKSIGNWNEQYLIEDGDMWVRIASKYPIAAVPKYLFFYRQHSKSFSNNAFTMFSAKMQWLEVNKHLNKTPELTLRNNVQNYLSKRVMQQTSLYVTIKVISHFRWNKGYFLLLIKSFIPLTWKQALYKRKLIKKYKHIIPAGNHPGN